MEKERLRWREGREKRHRWRDEDKERLEETGRSKKKPRQRETKVNETDRQAQERVCRGAREDGQVRPAERG